MRAGLREYVYSAFNETFKRVLERENGASLDRQVQDENPS